MTAAAHRRRFRRVLDHIDARVDENLSVARLSDVAAYSKHHFHRQFAALFGVGVYRYVQLVRFNRASYRLAFRSDARILDLALDSGYESHEGRGRQDHPRGPLCRAAPRRLRGEPPRVRVIPLRHLAPRER